MSTDTASLPRAAARWLTNPKQDTKPLAAPDCANLDDRDLATHAARGLEPAFRELLSRNEWPAFSLIYRMGRDRTLMKSGARRVTPTRGSLGTAVRSEDALGTC
ncbi:MAG: hypothetical protein P8L45_02595 [Longimicrobiales bacterium]|nr:hypothetical protein [Longimicrobiales bacterium]